MNDHFQRPLWPIYIILIKLATILENNDWCQLSPKKNWEVLIETEGIQAISVPDGWNPTPPPPSFLGLKEACLYIYFVFMTQDIYPKVGSSNTSRLEGHSGFFRLLMKGIFNPYVLWPFAKNSFSNYRLLHQNRDNSKCWPFYDDFWPFFCLLN